MNIQQNVVRLTPTQIDCNKCQQNHLCLPKGLDPTEMDEFSTIVKHSRIMPRGSHIFRQGDRLRSLYLVRSGMAKCYVSAPDGTEQIVGFRLPGDMLGLDALGDEIHTSSAVTLDSTSLCELSFSQYEKLCGTQVGLWKQISARFGKELSHDHELLMLIGQKSVEERLAIFLLKLSQRMAERGFSATEYNLSMTRYDIANFLGVTAETISRTFSRFEKIGLLKIERKKIRIKDLFRLRDLAFGDGHRLSMTS